MRLHRGLAAVPSSLLALGLAATLALSGCTSFSESVARHSAAPASTSPAEPKAKPIAWSDCDEQLQPLIADQPGSDRNLKFECGHTDVPISYAEPRGATPARGARPAEASRRVDAEITCEPCRHLGFVGTLGFTWVEHEHSLIRGGTSCECAPENACERIRSGPPGTHTRVWPYRVGAPVHELPPDYSTANGLLAMFDCRVTVSSWPKPSTSTWSSRDASSA